MWGGEASFQHSAAFTWKNTGSNYWLPSVSAFKQVQRNCGAAHLVALEMAHAASFLMSNSAVASRWMSGGTMPASTTVCRAGHTA